MACRQERNRRGRGPTTRATHHQVPEAETSNNSVQTNPSPKQSFVDLPVEIHWLIWDLAGAAVQARREALEASGMARRKPAGKRRPSPRMEVYATMSLVCRRLRAVALASGVMYRNLQLFTNCPGRPFDWMFYLLGKGAHITSRNTWVSLRTSRTSTPQRLPIGSAVRRADSDLLGRRASIRSTWQYQYQEQPDGQLVKKPVLKPVHPKLSLAVARLLARMPELRELRLLDPVYPEALTRALRAGKLCLPTVEVLTMKVAEHRHHHDHTADAHPLVVRACPRLTALGLNMDGPSSGVTGTVDATDCLKAVWRAAGELAVLEEVRVLKFGFDAPCWLPVPGAGEGSRSVTAGWMLDDVDGE